MQPSPRQLAFDKHHNVWDGLCADLALSIEVIALALALVSNTWALAFARRVVSVWGRDAARSRHLLALPLALHLLERRS